MAKSNQVGRIEFLRNLWSSTPGKIVDLRAIHLNGGKPIQEFARTPAQINEFSDKYGQRGSNYSVFFGVCKRSAESGKKQAIDTVPALWADIDTVANGYAPDVAMKLVAQLPQNLLPSAVVNSGGGLHLYWFLSPPMVCYSPNDQTYHWVRRVEDANIVMRDLVGGDAVQDITRVMRMPETYNNKRKPSRKCEVVYCQDHRRYDVGDLIDAALAHPKVLDGQQWTTRKKVDARKPPVEGSRAMTALSAALDSSGEQRALNNLSDYWRDRVREHAPRGYVGIHEASLLTTARLHLLNWTDDLIVAETIRYMQGVPGLDHSKWDWPKETEKVRGQLQTWKPKADQIKAEYRAKKRAARNVQSAKV